MADDTKTRDFLEWTPFVGSLGLMAKKMADEGSLDKLGQVWQRGQRAGRAMQTYMQELSRQQAAELVLPRGLTVQQESYILDVARHATGTRERLAHVQTFSQVEALKGAVPEFYQTVARQAQALRGIDPGTLLIGQALEEAIPETAGLLTTEAIYPSRLNRFLQEIEQSREAGKFSEPFLKARKVFQEYLGDTYVEAVKRKMRLAANQEVEQIIALRMSAGGVAVEIPVMTANREFINRTGATYMPSFWELGEREIAPDVRILEELTAGLENLPAADRQAYLDDIIDKVARRSVYEANERAKNVTSPLAKIWMRGRAVVPGETPQDIARQREAVAKQAWQLGRRDRTSGGPASWSQQGNVFRRSFRPEEWSLAGRLADDKYYKTFARSMPMSQESLEFWQQAQGRTRMSHLLTPSAAPKGYYQAAEQTGERLLNLNYGMIAEGDLEALEEQFLGKFHGRNERRLFLKMTEDEMIMASEFKDYWQAERPISYVLDETHGISPALAEGAELAGGEFLGVSPLGRPIYAGRRGGQEFVEALERSEGKITARIRNVVGLEPGTKVFGTGGIKHTVRQTMRLSSLQALYAYYLTNFKNISPQEARRLARSVTAITVEKGFKNPEQQVTQMLSSLATYQQQAEEAGLTEAEEAAGLLRKFGFQRAADRNIAGWQRTDFSMSPESILYEFQAAGRYEPEGVLAQAGKQLGLMRSEMMRMGPPMQDLGAGNLGTFSMEMANVLFDQGHENLAMHLLGRTDQESQQVLRGLSQMMEPFEGGPARYGTDIKDLLAEQIKAGERGVADWLAHRGSNFPMEGIIHFPSRELPGGQKVSYLRLPEETLASLQGVYLEDGRTAASVLQRSFYNTLTKLRESIHSQPGTPAYHEATQALQNYYDTLGRLVMGKKGAARGVTGGKVAQSMQLQAASFFSGLEKFKDPASYMYITDEAMEEMLRGLSPESGRGLLRAIGRQGKYGSVLEAFQAGEALPGLAARYPGESSYAALPIRFRSANWALQQVRGSNWRRAHSRFTLGNEQIYIDPDFFKLMVGDYDSDVVHAFLATGQEAAEEVNRFLSEEGINKAMEYYQANLRTTSVKGKAGTEFTNSIIRILSRLRQQQAGKADIGIISNAVNRMRDTARMIGQPALADWSALVAESLTIKAKHHSLDKFIEMYNPESIIAHLEGTGLGMTVAERVGYFLGDEEKGLRGVLRELDPTLPIGDFSPLSKDMKPIIRGGKPVSYMGLEAKLTGGLTAYDQSYKRSVWDRITRLFKRPAAQTSGSEASGFLRLARGFFSDNMGTLLMGQALDDGGWRTQVRNRLTGLTAAAREGKQIIGRHSKWLGLGLAAGAGIALLRAPKPLTPEQVTGEDLQQQGAIRPSPQVIPQPTARVAPRSQGLNVQVRGRSPKDLPYQQVGQDISKAAGTTTRVTVDNYSKRFDREDIRRLRRK